MLVYRDFYPPKSYKIHYPNIIQVQRARKSHTCEKCNCEIPKGDSYYRYKPYPDHHNRLWYGWRKRCLNCKPIKYDEKYYYEDENATTIQVGKY